MSLVLEDFYSCPSESLLERCTKEQLIQIAEHFSIDLTTQDKKLKDVYSALTLEQSGRYDIVKSAVLHAYELVPLKLD